MIACLKIWLISQKVKYIFSNFYIFQYYQILIFVMASILNALPPPYRGVASNSITL